MAFIAHLGMLLLSFGCSLVLLARGLWQIQFGAARKFYPMILLGMVAVVGLAFLTVDLIDICRIHLVGYHEVLSEFGCMLLILVFAWLTWKGISVTGTAFELRRKVIPWMMIAIAALLTSWSLHRFYARQIVDEVLGLAAMSPGGLEQETQFTAVTDKGNFVPLFRFKTNEQSFEAFLATSEQRLSVFENQTIERGALDTKSNCHGWVFTKGRFLLKGMDVETILADHQYAETSDPKPGDLIIYRDGVGRISHTGLVQAVLLDGTVITESKWGINQRFLHLPTNQPYGDSFKFLRTQRKNHWIQIEDLCDFDNG